MDNFEQNFYEIIKSKSFKINKKTKKKLTIVTCQIYHIHDYMSSKLKLDVCPSPGW